MPSKQPPQAVLITGSSGFSGRHLADYLREQDEPLRLIGLDLVAADDVRVDQQLVGDLCDVDVVAEVLAACRPAVIIHLAGCVPPAPQARVWAANVGATVSLLEAVRRLASSPRVLVVGSAAEYGPARASKISEGHPCRPTTTYGRTKLAQTLLCRQYCAEFGLPIVIVRPFNLFGPGMAAQTVIGELCSQIASAGGDRTIRLGNLDTARDFVDVRDAVRAYWAVARRGAAGEVYNVCTGRATTIRQLADMLLGTVCDQYAVESQAGRFQEGDVEHSCGDCGKLVQLTGERPGRDLRASLRDTLAFFCATAGG